MMLISGCGLNQAETDKFGSGTIQMQAGTDNQNAKIQSSLSDQGFMRVDDGNNEIEIQEVKFFLEQFEMYGTRGTSDYELEELDDFIVTLPLDGSPLTITQGEVPAGFYIEFEIEIAKPGMDVQVTDSDFRDETGDYAVVVKGLYNGEEFMFRTPEDFEIEVELDTAMEFPETKQSILVVEIFVPNWFMGGDGMLIDPNNQSNHGTIKGNIEKSFEIFGESFDD